MTVEEYTIDYPKLKKWQVKTIVIKADSHIEFDEIINEECEKGWEPFSSRYDENNEEYIIRLKRLKYDTNTIL